MRLEDKGSTIESTVCFDQCSLGSSEGDGVSDTKGLIGTLRTAAVAIDDVFCPTTISVFRPAA